MSILRQNYVFTCNKLTSQNSIGISRIVLTRIGGDLAFSKVKTGELIGVLYRDDESDGAGVSGISITGLVDLTAEEGDVTNSDCPVERNKPFLTGHGAWLAIIPKEYK